MTDIQEKVRAGLKRRYAAERRFRLYGLFSILLGLCFLLVLFVSIIGNGYTAFQQTFVNIPVYFDPDVIDPKDPHGAFEGRKGARLLAVSTADGRELAAYPLTVPPVFDGLIAAHGKLFMAMADGTVACWSP